MLANRKSLDIPSIYQFKYGYSFGGRALFIPMKASQWRTKPKKLVFPSIKLAAEDHVL